MCLLITSRDREGEGVTCILSFLSWDVHEIKINQQSSEGSSFIVVSKGNKEIEQGIDEKTRITFNLGFDSSYDLSQILFYLVIYIYTNVIFFTYSYLILSIINLYYIVYGIIPKHIPIELILVSQKNYQCLILIEVGEM